MIAPHHREDSSCVGKYSFFDLFYIGSVDSYRYVVFTFTGSGTRMTTDTFSVVNYKSIFHIRNSFVLMRIPFYSDIKEKVLEFYKDLSGTNSQI